MLLGAATTTPTVCYDSVTGETHRVEGSGNEEEEDEDNVDSSQQQGSGETGFPNSQDMFITLDLEPVTPELTQVVLPDPEGTQGTSAANVSPSQRLVKIRRRKRQTRMTCSRSSRCPPTLKEHSRMRGGSQCQTTEKHSMNERRGGGLNRGMSRASGGLKMIGGVSLQTEGESRCSGCWSIKLICSSVWLSCRKGSRSRDCRYSPCVTNSPPPQIP
ncbi:uncharacterized protein LOC128833936 [Malaclemys terrapin pileata]|uniref:uncharacterized protein LOC128833936 n=1 Tax=Malaclemys terrapin pileata TaxID=2991368 RepID=UPI0023A8BFEF|nr:uncharacterized protein LOC128833936 [Malaclemys terrapin pileata]